ncbi:hypothetical protein RCL_jg13985.t1 [Rhizophagus clarus]|uniref:Uncharacterized protein n=1 Tax=Rhizophagus clarus TaxID=94130 RepID=A0A8H3QTV5_9GLOM|nr:hypothetical protein RCL_jg13985.t1 [Rhizophagus clarus]
MHLSCQHQILFNNIFLNFIYNCLSASHQQCHVHFANKAFVGQRYQNYYQYQSASTDGNGTSTNIAADDIYTTNYNSEGSYNTKE